MIDRRRAQILRLAAEDLALLVGGTELATPLRRLTARGNPAVNAAARLLDEYAPGYPAGGMGTAVSGSRDPDKIGQQVADRIDTGKSWPLPRELDGHLAAAAYHLREAARIVTAVTVPINAAAAKTADTGEQWCASCARLRDHQGRPRCEPAQIANGSTRHTPDGTAGGKPGTPLCGWCYGFALGEKTWPTIALLQRRADGHRISAADVDKALGR